MKHTQGEWKLHDMEDNVIVGVDHISIADVNAKSRKKEENKGNAEFIVRACNSHYELKEACENLLMRIAIYANLTISPNDSELIRARQAIAKAEGEGK